MKKLSIRRRAAITLRGYGLLRRYCPGLLQNKALHELVRCTQPFLSIWFSARIIDELFSLKRAETAVAYAAGLILVNFICAVLKSTLERAGNEKQAQMWDWFRKIFSDKQMALDFVDLEDASIQRQRQQVEENLYMYGNGMSQLVWGIPSLICAGVTLFLSLIMALPLFLSKTGHAGMDHPLLSVGVLLCTALGGLCYSGAAFRENAVFMKWCAGNVWFNRAFAFFGGELCVSPERAKDVRIYAQSAVAEKSLDELIGAEKENQKAIFKMALYPALATAAIGLSNALGCLFVALKAFFGAFGAGSAVQYAAVLSRLGDGVRELMFLNADNAVYCLYLQEMFAYLDIPNRRYQGSLTTEKREDNDYAIEFRDLSFRYPGAPADALQRVSLKLRAGERLAVVGMNGSGKTTLIKLLCRLYDPSEGEILLNGVPIQKYEEEEYRSLFSVVFQDFCLFSFGLGQNVAASAQYDEERVRDCLRKAGFGERLSGMPQGTKGCLYKDFDESGVEISGGEAQKIALARALYKNAPFIILDEPTAALDPVSEYEVYSSFNEIAGGKTAVYISHRLASCRFCDRIAVFHEGKLIQLGTHAQLLAEEGGKYRELWNAQARYYQ